MFSSSRDPPEIAAKLALLKERRETVQRLTQECQTLEHEIFLYRASVAPIQKCPREILIEVFQNYLDHNCRLIRRLMLVCRDWHSIVTGTPTLWTRVPIKFDTQKVDAKDVANSIQPRIDAALRYSQNLLIHIQIDLRWLLSVNQIIDREENSLLSRSNSKLFLCTGEDLDPATDFDRREKVEVALRRNTISPWNPRQAVILLFHLTGLSGEHMLRWKSFELLLPYKYEPSFIDSILTPLSSPTPFLTSIKIVGSNYRDDKLEGSLFPAVPSLKSLHLHLRGFLERSHVPYATLEALSLRLPDHVHDIVTPLRKCKSLISLELWQSWETDSDSINAAILLPSLREMSFKCGEPPKSLSFILPRLEVLHFGPGLIIKAPKLPEASPSRISWLFRPVPRLLETPELHTVLQQLLVKYPAVEELTVCDTMETEFVVVITEMKSMGILSPTLKLMKVVDETEERNMIRAIVI